MPNEFSATTTCAAVSCPLSLLNMFIKLSLCITNPAHFHFFLVDAFPMKAFISKETTLRGPYENEQD